MIIIPDDDICCDVHDSEYSIDFNLWTFGNGMKIVGANLTK